MIINGYLYLNMKIKNPMNERIKVYLNNFTNHLNKKKKLVYQKYL